MTWHIFYGMTEYNKHKFLRNKTVHIKDWFFQYSLFVVQISAGRRKSQGRVKQAVKGKHKNR